jgi:hypothetical protein
MPMILKKLMTVQLLRVFVCLNIHAAAIPINFLQRGFTENGRFDRRIPRDGRGIIVH